MKGKALSFTALVLAGSLTGHAEIVRKKPPDPPPAKKLHPGILNLAARTALASGAEYLLRTADTNYLNFVALPHSTRKVIAYGETNKVPVRYKWVEYDHPIYEHKYEEYEVFQVGGAGSTTARKVQKVKRRRVVGTKQVGTRKAKRLVRDPSGAVVRHHTRYGSPVFGPGAEYWPDKLPGDNALALLALLKSGVPQSDERLRKLAAALNDYVNYYGASDLTWNIAWMAAAFANLEDSRYKKSRDLLISRVLDGQIESGAARGLWGPVCINMKTLPVLLEHERRMGEALAELKAALPKKLAKTNSEKKKERLRRELEQEEARVKSIANLYKPVTQQGLRFESVSAMFRLRQNHWEEDVRYTAGLPYYIYTQQLADLESTALAMFALREAAANGCLPQETQVPDLGRTPGRISRGPLRPQQSSRMLARATAALASLQKRDGSYDQTNVHQPVTTFKAFGLPPLTREETPGSLDSMRTEVTSAMGYSALSSAGRAVGMSRLFQKYGRTIRGARRATIHDAEGYLDRRSESAMPDGRILAPYDLYFAMRGVHRSAYAIVENRRDLWMRFAYEVLELQHDSGKWCETPTKGWRSDERRLHSSSLWAWKPFSMKAKHDLQQQRLNPDKRKPFNLKAHWQGAWRGFMSARHSQYLERIDREVVATSLAMLFLSDGIYPPIGGYIDPTGRTYPPRVLEMVCTYLRRKQNISATCLQLTSENIASTATALPMIFMSGVSATTNSTISSALHRYLKDDGVVVVEAQSLKGQEDAEMTLRSLLRGSTVRPLPPNSDFLEDYPGTPPSMKALFRADKSLACLFISAPSAQQPGRAAQYAQVTYLLARHRIGPEYFDPRYPTLFIGDDPFVARVDAMAGLRAYIELPERAVVEKPVAAAEARRKTEGEQTSGAPAEDAGPEPGEIVPEDEEW